MALRELLAYGEIAILCVLVCIGYYDRRSEVCHGVLGQLTYFRAELGGCRVPILGHPLVVGLEPERIIDAFTYP